jgi:hypothetical protein
MNKNYDSTTDHPSDRDDPNGGHSRRRRVVFATDHVDSAQMSADSGPEVEVPELLAYAEPLTVRQRLLQSLRNRLRMMLEVPRKIDPHDQHLLEKLVRHAQTFLRLHGASRQHCVVDIVLEFYSHHFGEAVDMALLQETLRNLIKIIT